MRLSIGLLISLLILCGCSSAGSPVNPDSIRPEIASEIPVTDGYNISKLPDSLGLLGVYDLTINPETMTASLEGKRSSSAVGDSYLIEGMAYFTISPCSDCLKLESIGQLPDGSIQVAFRLRHPFKAPGTPCEPPSRADLDIFDVVLLVRPLETSSFEFQNTQASIYAGMCPNANGYTRELSTLINDSGALPFFLAVDDGIAGKNTYNKFAQGTSVELTTYFKPQPVMKFSLYLTFGYGVSSTRPTRCSPSYFNPEFNRKNAWKVEVVPPGTELGMTWDNMDALTEYNVEVLVWDWQQDANISDPLVNPTDVRYVSNVSKVSVEIPGMNSTLHFVTTKTSGSGFDPADPLVYRIPVANENLIPIGEYTGLVKVTDSRVPKSNVHEGTIDSLIHTPDGVDLQWMEIGNEFATFQTFTATVVEGESEGKNIGLREGFEAIDLAVDHADGDLFILYDDGEIWKHTEAGGYMDGASIIDEPGPAFQYIDIAPNSYIVVAGYQSGTDLGKFFKPDGTYFKDFNYGAMLPACFVQDALACSGSVWTNYLGVATCGCPSGTYAKWVLFPPSTYSTFVTPAPYKTVACGFDSVGYYSSQNQGIPTREIIRGVESSKNTMDYVYYLESATTSYVCDEYRVQRFYSSGSDLIADIWWGGVRTNDLDGFWNPQDITRDNDNNYYILDILDDDSPLVKKYTENGVAISSFGDADSIKGIPRRIEGSDYVGTDGNLLFVLSDDSPADKLSIFYPWER